MAQTRILDIKPVQNYQEYSSIFGTHTYGDFRRELQLDSTYNKAISYIKKLSEPDFIKLLTHNDLYYFINYRVNITNAFLYTLFIDHTKTAYINPLIQHGVYLWAINVRENGTIQPFLHYAVTKAHKNKNIKLLQNTLLAKDISVVLNHQDENGRTALELACEYDNNEIINVLLNAYTTNKVVPTTLPDKALFLLLAQEETDKISLSLLEIFPFTKEILNKSVYAKKATVADILFIKGLLKPTEFKEVVFNNSGSLFLATKNNNVPIVRRCLLSKNILDNINKKNAEGLTAAELSIQNNRYDILCDLYNSGADMSGALAMAGPLGITKLLAQANSYFYSTNAKDDLKFRRLLESYQKDPDLLDAAFSQLILDILERNIPHKTVTQLIGIFPDLKERLSKYVIQIVEEHKNDGIGAFIIRQSLLEKEPLYTAFAEPRGIRKNLTSTISHLTEQYGSLLDEKPEKDAAIALIKQKTKKMPIDEEKLETRSQITELLEVEKAILDLNLELLKKENNKEEKQWRYAFALAGPTAINIMLKRTQDKSEYVALSLTLKAALKQDTQNLAVLFKEIKNNGVAQNVLKQVAHEQKDFSQRILNYLSTLPLEEAYDILDKSLTNRNNPFHVIWSPNNQNTNELPCSLAWAKFKKIEAELLQKSREKVATYYKSASDDSSIAQILGQLRKERISAKDYKALLEVTQMHISTDSIPDEDNLNVTKGSEAIQFKTRLTRLINKYSDDMMEKAYSPIEFKRLIDKIKICQEYWNAIDQKKSVADIRKNWEKKPDSNPHLFKKSGLLCYVDNALGDLIKDIIKNEHLWVKTISNQNISVAAPPPFNPTISTSNYVG